MVELKQFIEGTQSTHVGKNLICDTLKILCFCKTKNCIKDCNTLLDRYYIYQENIVPLTEFAESEYCKKCNVKECKLFASGDFINCMKVVKVFMDGE